MNEVGQGGEPAQAPVAPTEPPGPDPASVAAEARRVLRSAASAVLATAADGHPQASLVTPAWTGSLDGILWLSRLSPHFRQLEAEPRCSLLAAGTPTSPNPQTAPRLSVWGRAGKVSGDEALVLKARWLARHPYAALYASFGDFALWRFVPEGAQYVGGFARAARIPIARLRPDPAAAVAIEEAEADILEHMNEDHAEACAAIATRRLGGPEGAWRMVAIDPDGATLALDETVVVLPFDPPVADPEQVRLALVRAARAARS